MAPKSALRDHIRENRLFLNRIVAAGIVVALLTAVLIVRLFYLQVVEHDTYTTLSHNNRVNIEPIGPTRGLIYDRNGVLLAENRPTFSLEIVPERMEDLEGALERLAKLIPIEESDLARFERGLHQKRRFEGVPLRVRLSEEEVARFAANRHLFPGVEIEARLTRHYPLGALTAHALGFVGRINERELQRIDPSNYAATQHIGKVGVEKHYEALLHGTVGYQQVETNARGRVLRVLERTPPVPGSNLYLSLDSGLQQVATAALGENRGAIVALDVRTGAVLALVSTPAYDTNLFVNGIDPETYKALQESPDQPLFNRSVRGQYPPGSTIKPFIALTGLEYGVTTPEFAIFDPGWYQLKGDSHKYRDWKRWGHGLTDMRKAIVESCDTYFYDLGFKLGIDRMHEFLSGFSLGQETGIDMDEELPGLLPSRTWKRGARGQPWYPGETLITAIGQGFMLTTPLQLANATATLASRGRGMTPRLAHAIQDPAGETHVQPPRPHPPLTLRNPAHWDTVVAAMEAVVRSSRGTARRIGGDAPYPIAGKTGTSQVFGIKQDEKYVEEEVALRLRDHALFVGFAPVADPRIAVAVIVENGGHGSSAAAPLARAVMDYYMESLPQ